MEQSGSWGFFVQDTWKVNRKLTLDYGIRYDIQLPERELWRRTSTFSRSVANPNANGLPGGVLYEVATVKPGFAIDEPVEALGRGLRLPPWEEQHRASIEANLVPIRYRA